jgi:DNA-binding LytR/AlgR family response regulator
MLKCHAFLLTAIPMAQIQYQQQENIKYLTHGTNPHFIDLSDILYLECDDHTLHIYLKDGSRVNEIYTLYEFEQNYSCYGFVRIDHDKMINLKYAGCLFAEDKQKYIYVGHIRLKISRRKAKNWKKQQSK